jgi:tetratricopeptide (TPR) repeat protein
MGVKKRTCRSGAPLFGVCIAGVLAAALLGGCSREEDRLVESLRSLEPPGSPARPREKSPAGEARIEELRKGIARYRKEAERTVEATAQIGVYYKLLALQYMQRQMYGEAYDSLQEAVRIHPENPILFYYSAVCAARMSQAQLAGDAGQKWLERAESLYRRALSLDPGYVDALYGLSVLLVYELDRPEEAEALLKRILTIQERNLDALFLLGNVYYRLGRLEEALETYRAAAAATRVPERRRQAEENAERVEKELYGTP